MRPQVLKGFGILMAFALAGSVGTARADECKAINVTYTGTFQMSFGTGPGGSNELRFTGSGEAKHLGKSTVNGYSTLGPGSSPLCMAILTDQVFLIEGGNKSLELHNAGEDCLDFSRAPAVHIVGQGATAVVGGTDDFKSAAGGGTYNVDATITSEGPGTASGTFVLSFDLSVYNGHGDGNGEPPTCH